MTRRAAARALALLVGCAMPLTGGCARADGLFALLSTPRPAVSATPTPSPASAPEATPTPFSVNPLYAFYHGFTGDGRAWSAALSRALYERNSADALALSLALSAHLVALSDIGASVCRLFASDGGLSYSGTVDGAVRGEGEMLVLADGTYAFTFTCNDGTMLAGAYARDSRVRFARGQPKQEDAQESEPPDFSSPILPDGEDDIDAQRICTIEKTAEGWTSTVEENGAVSIFSVSGNAVEFSAGGTAARLADGTLSLVPAQAVTEATAAP